MLCLVSRRGVEEEAEEEAEERARLWSMTPPSDGKLGEATGQVPLKRVHSPVQSSRSLQVVSGLALLPLTGPDSCSRRVKATTHTAQSVVCAEAEASRSRERTRERRAIVCRGTQKGHSSKDAFKDSDEAVILSRWLPQAVCLVTAP